MNTNQKIFYSCVIDNTPLFYWQGYIFITSLINIAKVNGERIFAHLTHKNDLYESFLLKYRVNIRYIQPWGDNKYCNKLQQLETEEFYDAEYVFFCDADMAILEDLAAYIDTLNISGKIVGKIVDMNNPKIEYLDIIFDYFSLKKPPITTDTLNKEPTYEGNFNGGLYGIPSNAIKQFGLTWKEYAQKMLEDSFFTELLGNKIIHIDQISFALALTNTQQDYALLSLDYNCPTHLKQTEPLSTKLLANPKILHYHRKINPNGLLQTTNIQIIDEAINKVNFMLEKNLDSQIFQNYKDSVNHE
ncbi:MAG: hypothetical protein PHW18_02595 [Sulfuricurvum sp.]|uniref:hypothetical protein n=1 Tax=Sulfuricurvum sp. TaxID=2025608 RepID=UPI00262EA7E1|nr:hypothetical protein [Sulfuricurvum sp.]MDD2828445.1 hypothetical protein [Sulfuricurvum sp.]MDD4949450.1 hypothetical protein [Sulfuricurvum sp.]